MYVIAFYCFYVVIDVFLCYCTALVAYSINNNVGNDTRYGHSCNWMLMGTYVRPYTGNE